MPRKTNDYKRKKKKDKNKNKKNIYNSKTVRYKIKNLKPIVVKPSQP